MTEVYRKPKSVFSPVIHQGHEEVLTHHGEPVARIVPERVDLKQAFDDLRAIGPVKIKPRK